MASTLHRNNKSIRFDALLNLEDEDQRTAHAVEERRERKQRKKQRKMVRAEQDRRVLEAFTILQGREEFRASLLYGTMVLFAIYSLYFYLKLMVHEEISIP